MIKVCLGVLVSLSILSSACALSPVTIKNLKTKEVLSINKLVDEIPKGTILVIGERHAFVGEENRDQKSQLLLIQKLVKKYQNVSVGMEFIQWKHQDVLDNYLNSKITEAQFLKDIEWSNGNPFEDYKPQILEVLKGQGWTFGLNAPKELTSVTGKKGLSGVPSELEVFLPPNFQLGNTDYKQRFFDLMDGMSSHGVNLDYYFQAQSIWDDSMAWKAVEIMKANPDGILVIIVGKFHAIYGGGLPARIKERGYPKVLTLIQSESGESDSMDLSNEYLFSKDFGPLSDYYW